MSTRSYYSSTGKAISNSYRGFFKLLNYKFERRQRGEDTGFISFGNGI